MLLLRKKRRPSVYLSSPFRGCLQHEMFAWKSMDGILRPLGDVSSSLMKLKLDMVYRDLPMETASQAFTGIIRPVLPETEAPKEKPKPKKKTVKVALPK
jgi:hypothetical protein